MDKMQYTLAALSMDDVFAADAEARRLARESLKV
jgi:hypothetical protein